MDPDAISSDLLLSVRKLSTDVVRLLYAEAYRFTQSLQLVDVEVEGTRAVLTHVEVLVQLGASGESQLSLVIPAVVAEEQLPAGHQAVVQLLQHSLLQRRRDGGEHEQHQDQVL